MPVIAITANTTLQYGGSVDTTLTSQTIIDTYITNDNVVYAPYGDSPTQMNVGGGDNGFDLQSGLIKSAAIAANIPSGATINSATLRVYRQGVFDSQSATAHSILRDWDESFTSWNNYDDSVAWATPGALDATDTGSALSTIADMSSSQYYEFAVAAAVQAIIDGTGYGVLIRGGADTSLTELTSSIGTDGQRPEFIVDYTVGSSDPAITDVDGDNEVLQGQTSVTITGTDFEASQGTGTVILSPADDIADAGIVTQTVTSWADTAIDFTANFPAGVAEGGTAYLFVTNDTGDSNAAGFAITREVVPVAPTVDAGTGGSVTENTPYSLDATVTPGTDSSPTILWSIQSGGTGTFSDTGIEDPTFTPTSAGAITLLLTVTPDDGPAVTDTVVVTGVASVTSITVTGITGGANLTALQWMVLDGPDLSTASIIDQGSGETTDGTGDLEIILSAGPTNGQSVWYIIKDVAGANAAQGPATVTVT